jgi:hypothetical protein
LKTALLSLLMLPLFADGKNKIAYDSFDWKIFETKHFKVFYYSAAQQQLHAVADMAEAAYAANSEKLQHQIDFKIPLVIYLTHEEFEQTNIFGGFVPRYVGAFADPFQSRMVLPIDLPPQELYELIAHELTHIFQYDMLFNNRISTIIRASAPTWFIEGMASYIANDEDNLGRMVLRDAAVNAGFNDLSNLRSLSYMAYRVGNAVFSFMEQEWGIEGIRNFLWEYRKNVTGGTNDALRKAFELEPEEFSRMFKKYLRKRYIELLPSKEEPDDHAAEIRTRKVFTTLSPELSPSGDLFAAVVPIDNELDVVLISTKDGRIFKNLTRGYTNRYTEINVNAFSGINDLAWSQDGNEIAFTVRAEGTNRLIIVNVLTGKMVDNLHFEGMRSIASPAFGNRSDDVYFRASRMGSFDIFHYQRSTATLKNLTQDAFEDRNPRISPDGKSLLYSSIREGFHKIILFQLEQGTGEQITSGLGNDLQASFSQDMSRIYFSSDRFDDIYNIYSLDLQNGELHQYTDVLTGAFAPQERIIFDHKESTESRQLVFSAFYEGRYRIYRMDKPEERMKPYPVEKDNFTLLKNHPMSSGFDMAEGQVQEYRPLRNFSVSGVDLGVGVTDDGRFLSNSRISFSDVLGNHNLDVMTYTISSYETYYANYLNRTRRLQWGIEFNSEQYFFVDRFIQPGTRIDRAYKSNVLAGYMRLPFNLFTRIDGGAGLNDYDAFRPVRDENGEWTFQPADYTKPFATLNFSHDTVRYADFGPIHGFKLNIGWEETFDQYRSFHLDLRAYRELTRRTLLAWRTTANHSDGSTPQLFYLGGTSNLRGDFYYNEFVGIRRLLTQLELRFPFMEALVFPGFAIGPVRGTVFAELGGTWFDDDEFQFEFQREDFDLENPDTNYLLGSYGFEISTMMLGLELHWTWSRRTNFSDSDGDNRFSFWIGRTF